MSEYDVCIVGAGIAGSCLAIMLADAGHSVVVFEKGGFPSHKVCGEFLSMETYDFFQSLGLPLDDWNLPRINTLRLTAQSGNQLKTPLDMGGFGISRYKLDFELYQLMLRTGVSVYTHEKVTKVVNKQVFTKGTSIQAKRIIGAHGKYASGFSTVPQLRQKRNFIGVKYHIKGDFDPDLVALHSFAGGYCGMSKIEDETFCLCYLADSKTLRDLGNEIARLETEVLFKNKHIEQVFSQAEFLFDKPLVISNIAFNKRVTSFGDVLNVGDAAGSISPLSGNGMSLAAKSAVLLYQLIGEVSSDKELINRYERNWNNLFKGQLNRAELLNYIMLNPRLHSLVVTLLKNVTPLRQKVISDMHGDYLVRNNTMIRY